MQWLNKVYDGKCKEILSVSEEWESMCVRVKVMWIWVVSVYDTEMACTCGKGVLENVEGFIVEMCTVCMTVDMVRTVIV